MPSFRICDPDATTQNFVVHEHHERKNSAYVTQIQQGFIQSRASTIGEYSAEGSRRGVNRQKEGNTEHSPLDLF